jgi:GNAT superfamily N-acetyltransferase
MSRKIETLSLNAWPALEEIVYDGWILRFAEGYTNRANSVNPIGRSSDELETKITACENIYSGRQLDTVFKITPLVDPKGLDAVLELRGYKRVTPSSVRIVNLADVKQPDAADAVVVEETLSARWLDSYCGLTPGSSAYKPTMERMIGKIAGKTCFAALYNGERVVSCGFAVLEQGYVGLYDIVTDVSFRNLGYGEQLVLQLLQWGKHNGALHSYLQVVQDNEPASRLYDKIGFSELYRYWYRVKKIGV